MCLGLAGKPLLACRKTLRGSSVMRWLTGLRITCFQVWEQGNLKNAGRGGVTQSTNYQTTVYGNCSLTASRNKSLQTLSCQLTCLYEQEWDLPESLSCCRRCQPSSRAISAYCQIGTFCTEMHLLWPESAEWCRVHRSQALSLHAHACNIASTGDVPNENQHTVLMPIKNHH